MNSRRDFLKQLFSFPMILSAESRHSAQADNLCILHSSELQSCCEGAGTEGLASSRQRYKALYDYICNHRQSGTEMLLLDSGNFLSSNPVSDISGGRLESEMMQSLGYDALCFGEQEISIGADALIDLLKQIKIPIVSSNAHDEAFRQLIVPHLILKKGPFRVGIMALNREDGFIQVRGHPLALTVDKSRELVHKHNCNLVVCLSRLSQEENDPINDWILAANTENIQLIIGGRSHGSKPHPIRLSNLRHQEVWVAGNPEFGAQINCMEYKISGSKKIFLSKAHTVEIGK